MRIYRSLSEIAPESKGGVVAIGNFDGVHRGHRALIDAAREFATREKIPAGVVTFEPHPRQVFNPATPPFRLTPALAKAHAIEALGADFLVEYPFTLQFAGLSAAEFVERILVESLAVRQVVVGYDFVFGHKREGHADTLRELAARNGFGVTLMEPVTASDGTIFTSTAVREALKEGKPREAARLLGRDWEIDGKVEHGDKRGRTIGFPTANIRLAGCLEPAEGIYAVRISVDGNGKWLPGAAYFGRRPTFDKTDLLLEVHLLDYAGDLYGRELRVRFVEFLRPDKHFHNVQDLTAQMKTDCDDARRVLANEKMEARS